MTSRSLTYMACLAAHGLVDVMAFRVRAAPDVDPKEGMDGVVDAETKGKGG
jgi:hypothetical protein